MAELSGFEVLALVKEIELALRGTYVNNIYTLGNAQLLRLRGSGGREVWLVASPTHGVWISERVSERAETTEFTTKLRRELERTRFSGASQVDLDRVFELRFGEEESARTLIVELMPPGNIVLTDPGGKILLVKDEVRAPARKLSRGMQYRPPPQRRISPADINAARVAEMAMAEKTVGAAIGRHIALPRKYVEEALTRLALEMGAPASSLSGRESEVALVVTEMVDEVRNGPHPCAALTEGGEEIFSLTPRSLKVDREAGTLSALCDELLLPEASKVEAQSDDPAARERRELEATLSGLKAEMESLLKEAARLRSLAQEAGSAASLEAVGDALAQGGVKPRREISSASAGASLLYDRAKELEGRAVDIEKTISRLSKRSSRGHEVPRPTTKRLGRRKQEWFERFRWFRTSGGKLALGGRDAHSNSLLVRRHLEPGDVVYHADLFGSPFFVLKEGRTQTEAEVREVAQATVGFSSAWKTGLSSADAYWVFPDQVSSAAPSGEYLAKGSFAIRGKKNFVQKNLVELAIGVDENGRVISGPESALSGTARGLLVLRPHREKGSETAKRVLRDLRPALGVQEGAATVDDILRALPAGGGKVVRRLGAAAREPPD